MRSPTINNDHTSSHQINTNMNDLNLMNNSIEYSISELQEMLVHQQGQIEQNQQLLYSREQRLKYLNQQQPIQENIRVKHLKTNIEQQEIKNFRLKLLQNEINQQKKANSTFENELEILKQIFLNKEHELTSSIDKLDDLTKQLDQLRKLKFSTNNEQSLNKNQLDKLKQELIIRNNLNEQQNVKIAYQRQLFERKQNELNQLDQRIEQLQENLKRKRISQPSSDFRSALNNVQQTLNNINIGEIEKRMVQLANSFNSIPNNQYEQINNSNSSKKINGSPSSNSSSKIAFASKSDIAATYMAHSATIISSPIDLPMIINNFPTDRINFPFKKSEDDEKSFPTNLRLNDDKLSVHYNNITSNIKKRYSLSDSNDSLLKYLTSNIEQQQREQEQGEPIQVRDDSLINVNSSESTPIVITYENPVNIIPGENDDDNDQDEHHQTETIIDSFLSDTQSEGSISDDIESITIQSFSTPPTTNLKSLLKTPITPKNTTRRVIFDPLALLLDAAVLGELDLLIKSAKEVKNPSEPNDEGLTALHNAVCASNFECVKFLIEFGCDINYADNDGWTPLHCAASCNNTLLVKLLIEHGASIYATTIRDNETPLEKCEEEEEENYIDCSQYLLQVQNDLGVINDGLVYALYDYEPDPASDNELEFKDGDKLIILRRGDQYETDWWWAKHQNTEKEGYIPRNYIGLHPRTRPDSMPSTSC